jgi:hypothetical protein
VETALSGADKLFVEMGYSAASQQVLELPAPRYHTSYLCRHKSSAREGGHPVNIDAVTSVARDCVLACVECGVLEAIQAGLAAAGHGTDLAEVVDFRKDHIGPVDQAVRELTYRKNQLRSQAYQFPALGPPGVQPAAPFHPAGMAAYQGYLAPQTNGYTPHMFPPSAPGQPYNGQPYPGVLPAAAIQQNGFEPPVFAPGPGPAYSPPGLLPAFPAQAFQAAQVPLGHSPAGSSSSTLRGQIPTTILELTAGEGRDDRAPGRPERGARPREQGRGRGGRAGEAQGQGLEAWDYVYRQLETQGYTKDQAERPDVRTRAGP